MSEDAGQRWGLVWNSSARSGAPTLDPERIHFFHAELCPGISKEATTRSHGGPPLRIIKNVYHIPNLFRADHAVIVNRSVMEIIARHADVEFVPVVIEEAYEYPFHPGDTHETDGRLAIFDDQQVKISSDFIQSHRVDVPQFELFQVRAWRFRDVAHEVPDGSIRSVYITSNHRLGITSRRVRYSRELIAKYGFIIDMGYVMSIRLFRELQDYIDPVFHIRRTFLY